MYSLLWTLLWILTKACSHVSTILVLHRLVPLAWKFPPSATGNLQPPRQPPICTALPFPECHVNRIIQGVVFRAWLLSLTKCIWDSPCCMDEYCKSIVRSFLSLGSSYGCSTAVYLFAWWRASRLLPILVLLITLLRNISHRILQEPKFSVHLGWVPRGCMVSPC